VAEAVRRRRQELKTTKHVIDSTRRYPLEDPLNGHHDDEAEHHAGQRRQDDEQQRQRPSAGNNGGPARLGDRGPGISTDERV
jgi:hypothetical protein